MTKKGLLANVAAVAALLLAAVGAAVVFPGWYAVLKDFSGIFGIVAAAYLAYCFQKRQSFLVSLRDLWNKCVEAKGELSEYTEHPNATWESYQKASRALSAAIDMMRAVYRNISESRKKLGYYPYEPLHDMRRALESLGYKDVTPERRKAARLQIEIAWDAFRFHFLTEFAAPRPPHGVKAVGARDPRRHYPEPVSTETAASGR